MCPQSTFIIVGGGVGPAASVALHHKIVEMTDNRGLADQGHIPVIHLSMSPYILDRTEFLLQDKQPNPGINMGLAVKRACDAYSGIAENFVVGVPCNTFHSAEVLAAYHDVIGLNQRKNAHQIESVNMIAETAIYIKGKFPRLPVFLLSTRGTRNTRIYDASIGEDTLVRCFDLDEAGNKLGTPAEGHKLLPGYSEGSVSPEQIYENPQKAVMTAIYDTKIGIKGSNPKLEKAKVVFETVIDSLRGRDVKQDERADMSPSYCVILGCTEIPLAYGPDIEPNYIDPVEVLAAALIVKSGFPLKEIFAERYSGMHHWSGKIDPNTHISKQQRAEEFTQSFMPPRSNIPPRSKL